MTRPGKIPTGKAGTERGSAALEADALTTGPTCTKTVPVCADTDTGVKLVADSWSRDGGGESSHVEGFCDLRFNTRSSTASFKWERRHASLSQRP